jgi:hypothetical protein
VGPRHPRPAGLDLAVRLSPDAVFHRGALAHISDVQHRHGEEQSDDLSAVAFQRRRKQRSLACCPGLLRFGCARNDGIGQALSALLGIRKERQSDEAARIITAKAYSVPFHRESVQKAPSSC